jgi:fused signal recognition particle receptor
VNDQANCEPDRAGGRTSLLERFKRAVASTRESLSLQLNSIFAARREIDPESLDSLQEALITADIGVRASFEVIERVRRRLGREPGGADQLKQMIKSELRAILEMAERNRRPEAPPPPSAKPYIIMVVGVNGVGKTTTVGKLAHLIRGEGRQVIICAADTFRAAAADQLAIWAERAQVQLIGQRPGADPSAVLFDAIAAARARNADALIVDTAGRLHTKSNLMRELEKMRRVASREVPGAPHEVLLVIDAVTGQNGLEQAKHFAQAARVTGLVLTKLDGTAKGGIAIAIAKELGIPIRYIGTGEHIEDLLEFSAETYVESLFD